GSVPCCGRAPASRRSSQAPWRRRRPCPRAGRGARAPASPRCSPAYGQAASESGSPPAARSPGLRPALALEIERHGSTDEVLQGRFIELVAFVDVNGSPDVSVEAGGEHARARPQGAPRGEPLLRRAAVRPYLADREST